MGHSPFGESSPRNLWKKQLWLPVWQAGPVCLTRRSRVSSSQSEKMLTTFWTWPEVSPLFHKVLRLRL